MMESEKSLLNENKTQIKVKTNEKLDLTHVTNRKELQEFARLKGYKVMDGKIPLDFYKKEVNLVDFARAIGYEYSSKSSAPSASAFARQRWFYMEKNQMKFPQLERSENANSQILIGRRSEGPSSPNFKYNEHYYFSQELTHSGDRRNHGSIVDLVQMHFKADFKDAIRIVENFICKNNELKEKALPFHLRASSVNEASSVKRLESYYNIRPLSDSSFLNQRGISQDTIKHDYFRDRIFNSVSEDGKHVNTAFPISSENGLIGFEIRNKDFKSVQDFKNDGMWRSYVNHSNKVDTLTLCESSIDALSKHEIKTLNSAKNPDESSQDVYLSSAGNITGRQIDLLQKMIDKGLSRKVEYLNNVPEYAYKDIDKVTTQVDENGKTVTNERGEHVQLAHVLYNKPQKLVLGFDNDSAGQLLNAKVLGKLTVSEFFNPADKSCVLRNSEVSPYRNNKTNIGKLSWEISGDTKQEIDAAVKKVTQHFDNLNHVHNNKISEGKPFHLSVDNSFKDKALIEIEFKNLNKSWNLAVDAIKEVKFQNSDALKIDRPVLKDWNEDLNAIKGLDPVLKKKFEVFQMVNNFGNKPDGESVSANVKHGEKDELMASISRAMDKPKGMKL